MSQSLAIYRAAYRAAGHPGEGGVYLRIPIYVAETAEQAVAEPEQSIMQSFREAEAQLHATAARLGDVAPDRLAERSRELAHLSYEQARREKVIVGTPEIVARRLRELQDELGIQGILAELNCGRLIPRERVLRSLHLLCREVMPLVR